MRRAKYMVIDTETTGLFDLTRPADADGQPRVAHLAAIWADEEGEELDRKDFYVRPDGWRMGAKASEVNGLTTAFLREHGQPIDTALDVYADSIARRCVVVAFNARFDTKAMRAELRRAGRDDLFARTPNICVMNPMTGLCQRPRRSGKGPRWPNLTEALEFFGHERVGAHRAMADAEGALTIMRELIARGELPEARVHYAKGRSTAA